MPFFSITTVSIMLELVIVLLKMMTDELMSEGAGLGFETNASELYGESVFNSACGFQFGRAQVYV